MQITTNAPPVNAPKTLREAVVLALAAGTLIRVKDSATPQSGAWLQRESVSAPWRACWAGMLMLETLSPAPELTRYTPDVFTQPWRSVFNAIEAVRRGHWRLAAHTLYEPEIQCWDRATLRHGTMAAYEAFARSMRRAVGTGDATARWNDWSAYERFARDIATRIAPAIAIAEETVYGALHDRRQNA